MTFLTFHIWFLLQNRICLPQQLHTAWRHINITFLKKKIVLLEGPILRISFIKGSPDLLKIKKMKHKCTLKWINIKYTQVDLLRLKWRFLQRASDRPKSNAPCWQTLDRHLVIRHQKILLNVFRRSVIGAWSVSKKRLLNVLNNRVLGPSLIVDIPARCIKYQKSDALGLVRQ